MANICETSHSNDCLFG